MGFKLKFKTQIILCIIDILILVFQIILIGLIIYLSIIDDNFKFKNVIGIIVFTFSLIIFLIEFLKNIKNEYRRYYSISSILKFFSYSFFVVAYILIKQDYNTLNLDNIIKKVYYFTGLIGIILIIISIYYEFLISTPEEEVE
jgi:hypothetical protein